MKRKNFLLKPLLVLVLLSFSAMIATGQAVMCGDVNDDGTTDIVDALLIAQCYVGLITCPDAKIGDVNCDKQIDIVDALLTAQLYVDLITTLECCDTTETPTPTAPPPTPSPTHDPNKTPIPGSGAVEFSRQMGIGWNLGNSMEAMGPGNETAWGNPVVTQSFINDVESNRDSLPGL